MTHKERIDRILAGKEIDRPAASFWRHFYDRENSRDDTVKAMVEFQRDYDWDLVKINTRASYHIEDWGARLEFSSDPLQKPKKLDLPVKKTKDWGNVVSLDINRGALAETLSVCSGIVSELGREVYCVQTVFSPLSIAADLVESEDKFVEFLHENGNGLHAALENIAETFMKFTAGLKKIGISGIFFATTEWASRRKLSEEQYLEFGVPYDLKVLKAAAGMPLNIVHVCKEYNMLPIFRDYPAEVLSWNIYDEGNLTFNQMSQICDKVFMGGIDHINTIPGNSIANISDELTNIFNMAVEARLIIGPGCAIDISTPISNLRFIRNFLEENKNA